MGLKHPKGIKRPAKFLLSFGLIFIITALILAVQQFGLFRASAKENTIGNSVVRPVKVHTVSKKATSKTRAYPGVVNPASETKLGFRVPGLLVELNGSIGRFVAKGDVIARIDPRDFKVNLNRLIEVKKEAQARFSAMKTGARKEDLARLDADLAGAYARMQNADTDYTRYKTLLQKQIVSQAQYDGIKVAFDTATASVESITQELNKAKNGAREEDIQATQAKLQRIGLDVEAAQNALEDTSLRAPFDGYVASRYVENHENIRAGDPVISLLDMSTVEVHTAVPENFIVRRSAVSGLYCILEAYPDKRFKAKIKEIGKRTGGTGQSYPLTVVLTVPQGCVVDPGMAATVHVAIGQLGGLGQGFWVPGGAVFADDEGKPCVWRIPIETMTAVRVHVTTGNLSGTTIRILSGLKQGDKIVSAGARFLRDGQIVTILKGRG